MREKETILIVGIGEIGGIVLEFLSRIPGICDIITADANHDWGFRKTNSALLSASYTGLYPHICFQPLNLLNVDQTAEFLKKINPTLIYNGTTLQSWWVVNELPPVVSAELYKERCGLGSRASAHLALTAKLMKAVKLSGIDTYVINSSFPDAVNPSLSRVGLAPIVGIGNMDLIVPYIRKATSELLSVPMSNVDVEMIAHHYHCYNWCWSGKGYDAPHYLKVYVGKQDVRGSWGTARDL